MPETIEMLCDKLGVVVEELIPEIVAGNLAEATYWITFAVALEVALFIAMYVLYKKFSDRGDTIISFYIDAGVISVIWTIAVVAFLLVILFNIDTIICWNVAPKAKALQYIANWMVK